LYSTHCELRGQRNIIKRIKKNICGEKSKQKEIASIKLKESKRPSELDKELEGSWTSNGSQ